jgi:hypothetical protein
LPDALSEGVVAAFERRIETHSDPTWDAAHLLDPANAVRSSITGDWNLCFTKFMGSAEMRVRKEALQTTILRLTKDPVAAKRELILLQSDPLPDFMVQALELMTTGGEGEPVAAPSTQRRINFWANMGAGAFPEVAEAAVRLLSMHATSCASERNWSLWGSLCTAARNRLAIERANKLISIRGNSKQLNESALTKDDFEALEAKLDEEGVITVE